MIWKDFKRWFNRDFWRAFKNQAIPIWIPETPGEKDDLVKSVFESVQSARYAPQIPETELVSNKGFGVARTVPVFHIRDYCVYYFCIKELEDVLCVNRTPNTFGGWTLGGALRKKEATEIEAESTEYGRYSFNPNAWTKAFGEFNSLLFAQLASGAYTHVLQCDLSNFYDCIRLDILERWIREEGKSDRGWIIALLFYFLNLWNRRNTGLHPQAVGLPQDALADCSRILANFYLQRYDAFASEICAQHGAEYFRYADDQMILLNDPKVVDTLLLLLTRNLDRYGLRVNQKKVELWTRADLEAFRCRDVQAIFKAPADNKDPEMCIRDSASIGTNLLFFEKGGPTKEIWFYEHRVPDAQKAYSMTKPIRIEHLQPCVDWWGGAQRKGRKESEVAWHVTADEVKDRGYNLDFKNPHTVADDHGDPEELLASLDQAEAKTAKLRDQLKAILAEALLR